jgi:acyl-CoA hydrolase
MRVVSENEFGRQVAAHLGVMAAGRVPRVVASGNSATPVAALRILDRVVETYRLFVLNAQPGFPDRPGVISETPFIGAGMRKATYLEYLPCRLSLVPRLLVSSHRPDVVVLNTSLPVNGKVSMGAEVNILPAAVEAVRASGGLVVAQLNPKMPYTYGDGEIGVDQVDLAVEAEQPLLSPKSFVLDDLAKAIGERVAGLVEDGATLQLGIGGVPDSTLAMLTGRRALRVWTETFGDHMLDLDAVGALDAEVPLLTSFLFGSERLYAWAHRNHRVRVLRTELINDPAVISKQRLMTSINTALQVDLYAQANASWVRNRVFSGFGGQPDFVAGTLHDIGGKAIIALPSWHPKAGLSTVLPQLTSPVTSFQHSFIVSEQGVAQVWGCTQREQAMGLINNVAHPSVRSELTDAAGERGLIDMALAGVAD